MQSETLLTQRQKDYSRCKHPETGEFVNITERLSEPGQNDQFQAPNTNTTIGVVAINAALSPTEVTKVAQMAHDGLARSIHPVHTMFDGDTVFALSTGTHDASVNTVGVSQRK